MNLCDGRVEPVVVPGVEGSITMQLIEVPRDCLGEKNGLIAQGFYPCRTQCQGYQTRRSQGDGHVVPGHGVIYIRLVGVRIDPFRRNPHCFDEPLFLAVEVIRADQGVHEFPGLQMEAPGSVRLAVLRPIGDLSYAQRIMRWQLPTVVEYFACRLRVLPDGKPSRISRNVCLLLSR